MPRKPTQLLEVLYRQAKLKKLDAEVHAQLGQNPAFPWSNWGKTPRAGARWTEEEVESIRSAIELDYKPAAGKNRIGLRCFSELAWAHGRSGIGVFEKLKQLYRGTFWKTFTDLHD
jgi:hypothetical protein